MNDRKRWARRMIAAAEGSCPQYGSPEWVALPEGDRRKVAAVVVAAECWAREADELEERLWFDVEFGRIAFKAAEDAEYDARAAAHRDEWKHLPGATERYRQAQQYRRETYGEDYGRSA